MIDRYEAESIIISLAGGARPDVQDTLIYSEKGWIFEESFSLPEEGDGVLTKDEEGNITWEPTAGGGGGPHTHPLADIEDFGAAGGYIKSNGTAWVRVSGIAWADLTGVPATFTPAAHTHPFTDITGNLAYAQLPTGGGTWSNGGDLTLTGGELRADGGIVISGGSSFEQGSFYKDATLGLVMVGVAGSSYQWSVYPPAADYIMRNPAGTREVQFGGKLTSGGEVSLGGGAIVRDASGHVALGPGGLRFRVSAVSHIGMVAGERFYWDGISLTGDTYTTHSSSDVLDTVVGSVVIWRLTPTTATLAGDLLFTDATYDIGKISGTRPRDLYVSRQLGVGIPTTESIQAPLHVVNTTGTSATLRFEHFADFLPLAMLRARGSAAARTQTLTGDVLGGMSGIGYTDAGAYSSNAHSRIRFIASENTTTTQRGGYISFEAVATGASGISERFRVHTFLGVVATMKLFWDGVDGTGDTYDDEVSANIRSFTAGNRNVARLDGNTALADGDTSLLLERRAAGVSALQRVKWKDASLLAVGDKVMYLAA